MLCYTRYVAQANTLELTIVVLAHLGQLRNQIQNKATLM